MWWKDGVEETMNKEEEIMEMREIIAGAKAKEELLLDYIDNICGIIEAEMPLKEQDLWLQRIKDSGLWSPEDGC